MADNTYSFETLLAAGETYVFDNDGGSDWVFLNGTYPATPSRLGPTITMGVQGLFMNMTIVWVYEAPDVTHSISFVGGIENIRGSASDDFITGDNLANILVGDASDVQGGRDWLRGEGGHDRLLGVGGSDVLWGGDGDDRICGEDDPFAPEQSNFSFGDDTLRGDNGNDTLYGGYGTNLMDGGAGFDTADYSGFFGDWGNGTYALTANLDTGIVTVTQTDLFGDTYWVATDTLIGIEYFLGSQGNDLITAKTDIALPVDTYGYILGGAGNDSISGGRFLDVIYGGDGNDAMSDGGISIPVGGGNDFLAGGAGNDIAYVQTASTVVFELQDQGTSDLVISRVTYTLGANVEWLTLDNMTTPIDGTGNALGNWLSGTLLANQLTGLDGIDTLHGMAGVDTLRGGAGTDFLHGGEGGDLLYGGTDNDMLTGEAGTDLLDGGAGQDNLTGGNDNDSLFGRTEDDTLFGGGGDDRLQGGTGRDRLTGGKGSDTFVFATAEDAGLSLLRDTITDFTSREDHLNLSRIASGQVFISTAGFSNTAGEIRYDATRGIVAGDLDGDRIADWQITLQGAPTLIAGDLIL